MDRNGTAADESRDLFTAEADGMETGGVFQLHFPVLFSSAVIVDEAARPHAPLFGNFFLAHETSKPLEVPHLVTTTMEQSADPFVPADRTLPVLQEAVQHCRGCDLYLNATQAVFGELDTHAAAKKPKAAIMMIGEQPGDQEDRQGRPFIGPAGKLLDKCLEEVALDRRQVYVTNVVKHFRWEPRGKLRIHKKPSMKQIHACRPWLDAEIETVRPELIVCLGATAAQSLLGPKFRITQQHGEVQQADGLPPILATLHPSAILRARTHEDRERDTNIFLEDLRRAKEFLKS